KLAAARQDEVIAEYYGTDSGIGYTLGRTNINSCDFSSQSYTYVTEGDSALTSFSIAHDLRYKVPLIKRAMAASGNRLKLFASPWSPPAFMKDNNDMLHGGHLRPEYAHAWARYYTKFIAKYGWGMAFHWYEDWSGGTQLYGNVALVNRLYPNKHLLFTEGTPASFDSTAYGRWSLGEAYGRSMINDFNSGAEGWTDWNILL